MSAPTPVTRAVMLERDRERCADCGTRTQLEAQHRRAVGMGGSKRRPLLPELLTLCTLHNAAAEAEGQTRALAYGHKVRSWVRDCTRVPLFYAPELTWFELTSDGRRLPITPVAAARMMQDVYGAEYDEWVEAAA